MGKWTLAGVLLAITVVGCGTSTPPVTPSPGTSNASSVSRTARPPGRSADTAASCLQLRRWSNARLAAQTVIVPVQETNVAAAGSEVAAGAGGVILFGSSAPANLGSRLAVLRRLAPGHTGLLVMTDEEGGGVIPVLKHFPGLGGASRNTDYGAAHTLPWSRLQTVGLPPFVAGIRAGAPAIMISNAIVPGLTKLPASLSPKAVEGELVRTLHFGGLILTDSLSSGAISAAGFAVPRAAVYAIRAGADMVMYTSATSSAGRRQFHAIVNAEVAADSHGGLTRSRLLSAARAALLARHVHLCR